jgi:hypothetical protein
MDDNPGVRLRRLLALALILASAGAAQALPLGVHWLGHHGHEEHGTSHGAEISSLTEALVHGHEHAAGDPEHSHETRPSQPVRVDGPELQVAEAASFEVSFEDGLRYPGDRLLHRLLELPGASPPPLLLLCTLLI